MSAPAISAGPAAIDNTVTDADREELAALQREWDRSALGDRPPSMSAAKLRRMMELESKIHGVTW